MRDQFWELPLAELTNDEWENLCDRCGKCCLIKLEDEDTNEIVYTSLACKLFDTGTCACSNYIGRKEIVDDCLQLTIEDIPNNRHWLPETCAYIRRFDDKPIADWHPLLNGGEDVMHEGGHSMKNRTQSEEIMVELEDAIPFIDRTLGP